MNLYDLFEDRELAEAYLLNPKLVDLKQLPINELFEHGTLTPMECLMQMAFVEALHNEDYQLFFEALIQHKDNKNGSRIVKNLAILCYKCIEMRQATVCYRFYQQVTGIGG